MFPKGSNDHYTVGEFFGTGFYQYYSRHGAPVKNPFKRKFFEGVADRSILLTLMKQEVTEKWQKIYVNSPKSDTLQDVITEVGKSQPSIGDRKVEAIIYLRNKETQQSKIYFMRVSMTVW